MYCDGDIIEVNDTYRLKIEVDNDSENPLTWGWGTEITEIDNYRIWRNGEPEPFDDLINMAQNLHYLVRRGKLTPEKRDRALHIYMVWKGDTRSFEIREWRGYSQSDWATVIVLWDAEEGSNVYESWDAWRRGDVYTVVEQELKTYGNISDVNDFYEDWFDGESLGGCYLDEGYTAEDVAKDHFDNYPKEGE